MRVDDSVLLTIMVVLVILCLFAYAMARLLVHESTLPDCEVADVLLMSENDEWVCVNANALITTEGDF